MFFYTGRMQNNDQRSYQITPDVRRLQISVPFRRSELATSSKGERSAARSSPRSCLRVFHNCRRQHGARSRSPSSLLVASPRFVCTREPCVRKACGGGLPKLSRSDGDLLRSLCPPNIIIQVGGTLFHSLTFLFPSLLSSQRKT
jgi:hypothetical protein